MKVIAFYFFVFIMAGCGGSHLEQKEEPQKQSDKQHQVEIDEGAAVKRLIAQSVQESNTAYEKGRAHLEKREISAAIVSFGKAIKIYPPGIKAYSSLVQLLINLRQYDKALRVLERAGAGTNKYPLLYQHFFAKEWGYEPLVINKDKITIAPFKDNKKGALSFIFSDGSKTIPTNAVPLLAQYDYKASIAVVSGQTGDHPDNREFYYRGSWDEWRELLGRGYEMCNHTIHHVSLIIPYQGKSWSQRSMAVMT